MTRRSCRYKVPLVVGRLDGNVQGHGLFDRTRHGFFPRFPLYAAHCFAQYREVRTGTDARCKRDAIHGEGNDLPVTSLTGTKFAVNGSGEPTAGARTPDPQRRGPSLPRESSCDCRFYKTRAGVAAPRSREPRTHAPLAAAIL